MAVDEARRSRSYEGLAAAIGRDEAVTIFELLPPPEVDLATRADVQVLDERFVAMERRFDERFVAMERRFDERFLAMEQRLDERFSGVGHRLDSVEAELRGLRRDMMMAIAGQTRVMVLGVLTATVSIGGLSAAFARLF